MIIEGVKLKVTGSVDIDEAEAFRILCKSLYMDFVLEEDEDFIVRKNEFDENVVCLVKDGKEELYDDRGDLFVALRNVAVNMFPNVYFRSADYIYNK